MITLSPTADMGAVARRLPHPTAAPKRVQTSSKLARAVGIMDGKGAVRAADGGQVMEERSDLETRVTAAQSGDAVALATLLAGYHPQLRARAEARLDVATRARTAPEDILQEVYVQVFQQMQCFEHRGPGSFLTWVYTILDHKLIDVQRAAHRQVRDVGREIPVYGRDTADSYANLLDHVYADSQTPSRAVRRGEAVGALLACLAELPEPQRCVLQMRFLEGRSLAEVAAQLDKSEAAVAMMCHRAVRDLRAALDRRGEFTAGG